MLSRCFLEFSEGVWAFVIGLSQISTSLSYSRRRRRLNIVEPDETKFASHLTLFSL